MTEQKNGTMPAEDVAPAPLVEAIALDTLPKPTRGELTPLERDLAAAIAETASATTAARLAEIHATKEDATKRASAIKRLLVRAGVVPKNLTARTRLVAVNGGYAVAAYFGEPGTAPGRKPKK